MPAVPDLAALLAALVLLLVAVGLYLIARLMGIISQYVSIFGWHPLDVIVSWLHTAVHSLVSWAKDLLHWAYAALRWLVSSITGFAVVVEAAFWHQIDKWEVLFQTTLPKAAEQQTQHTNESVGSEASVRAHQIGALQGQINRIDVSAESLYNYAHVTIPAETKAYTDRLSTVAEDNAERQAQQEVDALQSKIEAELAPISGQLSELQKLAGTTLPAEIATAAQTAANEVNAAKQALLSDLAAQAKTEQQALSSGLSTLQGEIAIDNSQIGSLDQAVGITIPAAISAVAAQTLALSLEVDNCMVSVCGGPNSLENALKGLEGLFSITGELGFLAAAIKDPVGTADVLESVVGGIVSDAESIFDGLLSL